MERTSLEGPAVASEGVLVPELLEQHVVESVGLLRGPEDEVHDLGRIQIADRTGRDERDATARVHAERCAPAQAVVQLEEPSVELELTAGWGLHHRHLN